MHLSCLLQYSSLYYLQDITRRLLPFFLPAVTINNEPVPQTLEVGEIFESKQLKISQTIPATQETSQFKTPRNFEKKIYYIESEI